MSPRYQTRMHITIYSIFSRRIQNKCETKKFRLSYMEKNHSIKKIHKNFHEILNQCGKSNKQQDISSRCALITTLFSGKTKV